MGSSSGGGAAAPALVCRLCGKSGFATSDDFALHAALCFGPDSDDDDQGGGGGVGGGGGGGGAGDADGGFAFPMDYDDAAAVDAAAQGGGNGGEYGGGDGGGDDDEDAASTAQWSAWLDSVRGRVASPDTLRGYQMDLDETAIDHYVIFELIQFLCAMDTAAPTTEAKKGQKGGGRGSHRAEQEVDSQLGAILVFLPGWEDISTLEGMLLDHPFTGHDRNCIVLPLHGAIESHRQKAVFRLAAPGQRKIILSTNIAETSVTISDVVYVIDAGKHKEKTTEHLTGTTKRSIGVRVPWDMVVSFAEIYSLRN